MGLKVLRGDEKYILGIRSSRLNYIIGYISIIILAYLGGQGIIHFPTVQNFFYNLLGIQIPSYVKYVLLIPPIIVLIITELKIWFRKYHITDKRVVVEKGILSKSFESLTFEKVTDTILEERAAERIFGVGDIKLNTAGSEEYEIEIKGIRHAQKVQGIIDDKIGKETELSDESIRELSLAMKTPDELLQELEELREEFDSIEKERNELRREFDNYNLDEQSFDAEMERLEGEEKKINEKIREIKKILIEKGYYEEM